mmetsp:Transcript_19793/g.40179  ORF Transcript_19793/g.40179 Transcript_19793/m.40179 type:complete len:102 (-) Transcript_19793:133-438(-)
MQLPVPDPHVRDEGREVITTININIKLPDGSTHEMEVDQGQTVEYVRAYLHEKVGINFAGSTLKFDGRPMFDPMSLVDFNVQSGSEIECNVEAPTAGGGDI